MFFYFYLVIVIVIVVVVVVVVDCTEIAPKGVTGRYAEKFMLPWPVLCLYWASSGTSSRGGGLARGTVGGMVSLATRQTPQIDDNTPARGDIMMNNGGLEGG